MPWPSTWGNARVISSAGMSGLLLPRVKILEPHVDADNSASHHAMHDYDAHNPVGLLDRIFTAREKRDTIREVPFLPFLTVER